MPSFLGGCRIWCFSVRTFRHLIYCPKNCKVLGLSRIKLTFYFPLPFFLGSSCSSSISFSSSYFSCSLSSPRSSLSPSSSEVVESCEILFKNCEFMVYLQMYSLFQCPTTAYTYKKVYEGYRTTATFPNCLGTLDEKHMD